MRPASSPASSCAPLGARAGPLARGFTLIEVLVAVSILAVVAVLSWRGVDAMVRVQHTTAQRSDRVQSLSTALAQWRADLDSTLPLAPALPGGSALDWNGRTLRLLRLAPSQADLQSPAATDAPPADAPLVAAPLALSPGLTVVAWTVRDDCPARLEDDGVTVAQPAGPCWLRWQSPLLQTLGDQQQAWQQAASWAAQGAADSGMAQRVAPATGWQLLAYRDDAWVPLTATAAVATPTGAASAPASAASAATNALPDGLRLQLTLADHAVLPGQLTLDWMRPTLTRRRQ